MTISIRYMQTDLKLVKHALFIARILCICKLATKRTMRAIVAANWGEPKRPTLISRSTTYEKTAIGIVVMLPSVAQPS